MDKVEELVEWVAIELYKWGTGDLYKKQPFHTLNPKGMSYYLQEARRILSHPDLALIERKKNWELTDNDRLRVDILKTALEMVLVKAGIVSKGMKPTAPVLLTAANSYVQSVTPKGDDEGLLSPEEMQKAIEKGENYWASKENDNGSGVSRLNRHECIRLHVAKAQRDLTRREGLPDREKIAELYCLDVFNCTLSYLKPDMSKDFHWQDYRIRKSFEFADSILALLKKGV